MPPSSFGPRAAFRPPAAPAGQIPIGRRPADPPPGLRHQNWPQQFASACINAPLASVTLCGSGSWPTFTSSINANTFSSSGNAGRIRCNESLNNVSTALGTGWSMKRWYDLQGIADSRTLATATGNFLN
jgi:hypothetical protein